MTVEAIALPNRTEPAGTLFTPEDVARFQRDGYAIVRNLGDERLRREMLAATLDGIAREIGPVEYEAETRYPGAPTSTDDAGGRTIRRLKQALSRHFAFTEWAMHPGVLGRLRQLMGPDVVMPLAHHNCIMTKQPQFSSDTGWHQDIRYWSYTRPELVSVWLALGPERIENGCLRVIPGTHKIAFDRSRLDDALFVRDDLPENQELIAQALSVELEPGDALFFHARTVHAASRNHTDQTKYSVVSTYRPADNLPVPGSRSASLPELAFRE